MTDEDREALTPCCDHLARLHGPDGCYGIVVGRGDYGYNRSCRCPARPDMLATATEPALVPAPDPAEPSAAVAAVSEAAE